MANTASRMSCATGFVDETRGTADELDTLCEASPVSAASDCPLAAVAAAGGSYVTINCGRFAVQAASRDMNCKSSSALLA